LILSILGVLLLHIVVGQKPTKAVNTVQVVTIKCTVKDEFIILSPQYKISFVQMNDVYMCYKKPKEAECKNFTGCALEHGFVMETLTCKTFNQWDANTYNVYLVNGDKGNSTVLAPFNPATYRRQCVLGIPEVITVHSTAYTPTSITVEANITRDTYAIIGSASMSVVGSGVDKKVECKISSVDPKSSLCIVNGLSKCTYYKLCASITTIYFQTFTKCINSSTAVVGMMEPTDLHAISLGKLGFPKTTLAKWKGPKLNSSDEHYLYQYTKSGSLLVVKTTETTAIVEADNNSNFTVKLCNKCGCSEDVSTVIESGSHHMQVVASLADQVKEWQKKDIERAKMWSGVMGGIGGGFIVAMLAGLFYLRNKQKRKRNGLLTSSKHITYSHFNDEAVQL